MFGAGRHVEVDLLSAGADEAHEELLDGVGVVGGEGGPVGGVHAQLPSPLAVGAVELQLAGQQGGDELEDGVAHAVKGGGGQLVVVVHVVAVTLGLELESLGEDLPQDGGEELVIGDVLDLGPHHLPRLLVERLLVPVRVDGLQERGESVVLPHQHGVEGGQPRVVVHPLVPGAETLAGAEPRLQPAVGVVLVLGQQVTSVNLQSISGGVSGLGVGPTRKQQDNYN